MCCRCLDMMITLEIGSAAGGPIGLNLDYFSLIRPHYVIHTETHWDKSMLCRPHVHEVHVNN